MLHTRRLRWKFSFMLQIRIFESQKELLVSSYHLGNYQLGKIFKKKTQNSLTQTYKLPHQILPPEFVSL